MLRKFQMGLNGLNNAQQGKICTQTELDKMWRSGCKCMLKISGVGDWQKGALLCTIRTWKIGVLQQREANKNLYNDNGQKGAILKEKVIFWKAEGYVSLVHIPLEKIREISEKYKPLILAKWPLPFKTYIVLSCQNLKNPCLSALFLFSVE